jgi:hypothetical protein
VTEVLRILEDTVWTNAYIARNGRRELDTLRNNAAVLGTKIHVVARQVAQDRDYEPGDPEMAPYAGALKEFYDAHVRRVIATELSLVSANERVGGSLDAYVQLHSGEYAVVDVKAKRTAGITGRDRVQTALYELLLREHGYTVNRRIVVRLHTGEEKRCRWYAKSAANHIADVRTGRTCVELWHCLNAAKMRKKDGIGMTYKVGR